MDAKEKQMLDDNPEWTEKDFERARPASEVHGPEVAKALTRKRGRPALAEGERKEKVTLRLSPEVLEHFRGQGSGWQTRIDDALKAHVEREADPDRPRAWRGGNGVFLSYRDNAGRVMTHFVRDNGRPATTKTERHPRTGEPMGKASGREPALKK